MALQVSTISCLSSLGSVWKLMIRSRSEGASEVGEEECSVILKVRVVVLIALVRSHSA